MSSVGFCFVGKANMRWVTLDEWSWETPLSVPELQARLASRAAEPRFGSAVRHKPFVGSVNEFGFQLTPLVAGQSSLLPQFAGRWRATTAGSQIQVVVVPNRVLQVCLVILFGFLSTLVYESHWGLVASLTIGSAMLGWLSLLGTHLIGVSLADRKLRKLLEAKPIPNLQDWPSPGRQSPFQAIISRLAAATTVAIGLWLLGLIYLGQFSFTTRPAVDLIYVYWTTQAIALTWLFCLSGVRPQTMSHALTVICALETGLAWCLVVDGFAGDGRPILVWRGSPMHTIQQREQRLTQGPPVSAAVDLGRTGPHDFSSFRGPRRDGVVADTNLNPDWEAHPPRIVWQHPIGTGWSAFAVVGDYAITQEQRGSHEVVTCYAAATGLPLWQHRDQALFHEMMGGDGPRATPTVHEGRVYTLGATGILNCLDGRDGHPLWTVNVVQDNAAPASLFGMAGSPLIWRDLLIVAPGGRRASLVAYDRSSGHRQWAAGDAAAAYASPQLTTLGGVEQVLCFNAEGLDSHAAADGKILWNIPWVTPPERNNVCQPIVWIDDQRRDTVFVSSGYGKGCALFDIVYENRNFLVTPRWQNKKLQAKFASAVELNGHVYGLDNNILCCIDLRTGRQCWKGGRYGFGQLLLVGRHVLVLTDQGEIVLCDATPDEHREVARFPVLRGRTWTHPALSGDRLFIRNDRVAACIQLPLLPIAR